MEETQAITWNSQSVSENLSIELIQLNQTVGIIASGISATTQTHAGVVGTLESGRLNAEMGCSIRICNESP